MKNILFIHQSAELYGSDKTILMFISNLDKSKYKPVVVVPFEGPLTREFEKNNIEVVIAPVLKLYRKMLTPTNLLKAGKEYNQGLQILENLHKKYKFDLVYSHTLAALIGIIFARKHNVKHLWHIQEILAKPVAINKIFKVLLNIKANHKAIYDSKATMNFWIDGDENLTKKSDFIWNGLDASTKPMYSREHIQSVRKMFFEVDDSITVIGLVGRINSWKGQPLLLAAYHKIAHKYPQSRLVFIGSAPPNQEFFTNDLVKSIQNFKLENQVKIIPFQEDIWQLWDAVDIAVVPSTEPEPFGMVAIEAMLSKKPVIAANHGGLTEIVIDQQTGLFFEPRNSTQLADKLEVLLNDATKRENFGANGHQRAVEHFSLKSHVAKFEAIFEDIIQ